MSSRPAARLTSDLLARKGDAQPAAREEDLYRPQRPTMAVVELGDAQAAGHKAATIAETIEPAPEASLRAVTVSRHKPAADIPAIIPEPVADEADETTDEPEFVEFAEYTEVASPEPEVAPEIAPEATPDIAGEAAEAGHAPVDWAEEVEGAEPATPDVEADAEVVDEPDALAADALDAERDAEMAELAAADATAFDTVPEDLTDTSDLASDADVADIDIRGRDLGEPDIAPPPIVAPTPAAPLVQTALGDATRTADDGQERRSLTSALTIFGLSALVGIILAIVWLAADGKLPDLRNLLRFGAAPTVEETTTAAQQPADNPPASDAAPAGADVNTTGDVAAAAVAATESAANDANDTTAAAQPAVPAPELDVVRIGDDGLPLLAGRAAPLARLVILDNDQPIGSAAADGNGEWVFQGETRLSPGRHAFSVAVGTADADTSTSSPSSAEATLTVPAPEPSAAANAGGDTNAAATDTRQNGAVSTARQSFDAAIGIYYVVQLGSLPTEEDALRLWREISQRYPQLTEGHEPVIQTAAQSGGGTIHRLRTGPFTSRQQARKLCSDFKNVGQDCLVVKREKTDD